MKEYIFFGIKFIDGNFKSIKLLIDKGGLLVLPAAPALKEIDNNKRYHNALKHADIALFDSGFFCLLLKFLKKINVKKYSGLKFINEFLLSQKNTSNMILFIDPSNKDKIINNKYLKSIGIKNFFHYIAPFYQPNLVEDTSLLNTINKKKPKYIIINLGGGTQELLGSYLKTNLSYNPSIICSGAAIAFLTGQQARIPLIFDKIYIGWLVRIIFNPFIFLPRYLKAFKLIFLIKNI
jgi:N-acetylglucosaminyldiphosphoundecaprenol N-acetyl-beta-D-mannosaminyltransferase